ncbi:MAG: hypothetical protein HOE54_01960, partial [Gammaproteobacteria bacterium]|nr:hypothetical protein [Gammaproteobacteria bacterium]
MVSSLDNILHLFNEHSRKFATAISITLIVLMSLTVADTVLVIMEAANPPAIKPRSAGPAHANVDRQTYKISDLELFGKADTATAAPEVIDAPETKLNLELQGVFIAENENQSTAIVGERKKAGELYAIGDRLPGNATLAAVFVDHVLIQRGSRMEKLLFSDTKYRIEKTTPVADKPREAS